MVPFFQATLRNPIAEPGIMGISSAASLCQLLAVIILPEIFFGKIIFAIIGGLLAFGLLLLFQKKDDALSVNYHRSGIECGVHGDAGSFH